MNKQKEKGKLKRKRQAGRRKVGNKWGKSGAERIEKRNLEGKLLLVRKKDLRKIKKNKNQMEKYI